VTVIQLWVVKETATGSILAGPTIFDQAYTLCQQHNRDTQAKSASLEMWDPR
jgi:hypothetical protein